MFRKIPEASARESGPEGSRKPRTYASSREFWKLLETLLELGLVLLERARRFWTVLKIKAVQQAWLAL